MAGKPSATEVKDLSDSWGAALRRLLISRTGSAFGRFALAVDMRYQIPSADAATILDLAAEDLIEEGIEGADAEQAIAVLQEIACGLLPEFVADKIRDGMSAKLADMLAEYGSVMSLDTIRSVTTALMDKMGRSQDASIDASRRALMSYVDNLSDVLSEVTSVSELDTLDRAPRTMMGDFGITLYGTRSRIDDRRSELIESEQKADDGASSWRPTAYPGHMSDDEIRALFASLRGVSRIRERHPPTKILYPQFKRPERARGRSQSILARGPQQRVD